MHLAVFYLQNTAQLAPPNLTILRAMVPEDDQACWGRPRGPTRTQGTHPAPASFHLKSRQKTKRRRKEGKQERKQERKAPARHHTQAKREPTSPMPNCRLSIAFSFSLAFSSSNSVPISTLILLLRRGGGDDADAAAVVPSPGPVGGGRESI